MDAGRRDYGRGQHHSPPRNRRRSSSSRYSPSPPTGKNSYGSPRRRKPEYVERNTRSRSRSPATHRRRDDRPYRRPRSGSNERLALRCDESAQKPKYQGPDDLKTFQEAINDVSTRLVIMRELVPDAKKRRNGHATDSNYSGTKEDENTEERVVRRVQLRKRTPSYTSPPQKPAESSAASSSYENGRNGSRRNGSYDDDRHAKRESEYKNHERGGRRARDTTDRGRDRPYEKRVRGHSSTHRSSQPDKIRRCSSSSRDSNSRNPRKSSDTSSSTDRRRNGASSSDEKRRGKRKTEDGNDIGGAGSKDRENLSENQDDQQNEEVEMAGDDAADHNYGPGYEMCPRKVYFPRYGVMPPLPGPVIPAPLPLGIMGPRRMPFRCIVPYPHPPVPPRAFVRVPSPMYGIPPASFCRPQGPPHVYPAVPQY